MIACISIAGVSERDIDLLLLEEFQSTKSFQQWFITQVLGKTVRLGRLISAKRSVTHSTGESDLEVAFGDASDGQVRFLIENKVNAGFQQKQEERYRKRGDSYIRRKECSAYFTVVLAPSRYFGDSASTKGFDKKVTYEALLDWFTKAAELGARRTYKTALLKSAIAKGTLGYQPEEDKAVTDFWNAYWNFTLDHASELEMKEPEPKPSRAGFVYFRPPSLPRGIEICHKLTKGYVDLQVNGFGNRLNEFRRLLGSHRRTDMEIKQTGKSAALRVHVPPLDTDRPFADQSTKVELGVQAAKGLLLWYLQNRQFMPDYRVQADARKVGARR